MSVVEKDVGIVTRQELHLLRLRERQWRLIYVSDVVGSGHHSSLPSGGARAMPTLLVHPFCST